MQTAPSLLTSVPSSPSASSASASASAPSNNAPISARPIIAPHSSEAAISKPPRKQPAKRRALSCLPCRQHKLKCDRQVPCHSCTRYRREDKCRQHPPPSSVLEAHGHHSALSNGRKPIIAPGNRAGDASVSRDGTWKGQKGSISMPRALYSNGDRGAQNGVSSSTTGSVRELHLSKLMGTLNDSVESSNAAGSGTNRPTTQLSQLAGTSVLPNSITFLLSALQSSSTSQADITSFWRTQLTSLLPTQNQCDLLVAYYLENANWVYCPIHVPTFRKQYARFWSSDVKDADLIWLSLLYAVIACSALYVPLDVAEAVGLDQANIRHFAHVWYSASRQALHAGGFESKPCLTQLQTFLVTQLYWLATKNAEVMNSCLGQAVRNAQAINLDKDVPGLNCLETETRRRVWWELWNCDTFQSICLGRAPLIHTSPSRVPLPSNCNDIDITENTINPRPISEPTEMSANILRAETFKIFHKLFANDSEYISSYDYVKSIDDQLQSLVDSFPWYFQINEKRECAKLPPGLEFITWQHHILHSCICMQRIRMNRPFLHSRIGDSWSVCAKAANEVLAVYQNLRDPDKDRFRKSQKFLVQGYQIYSAAVALAAFLLVERSFPADTIRKDIEMVISDLGLGDAGISTMADGKKILVKMLDMYDRRAQRVPVEEEEPESLVPEISSVFGGEQTTRKYLRRCDIGYLLNEPPGGRQQQHNGYTYDGQGFMANGNGNGQGGGMFDGSAMTGGGAGGVGAEMLPYAFYGAPQFDIGLDLLNCEQWDFLLPDLAFQS